MDMENPILLERQRELMFEGKRWFDLVRLSKREGNNNRLINLVVRKFNDNQQIIKKKLESPYAIFYPYNKNELKVNPYLVQNPAYSNESSK